MIRICVFVRVLLCCFVHYSLPCWPCRISTGRAGPVDSRPVGRGFDSVSVRRGLIPLRPERAIEVNAPFLPVDDKAVLAKEQPPVRFASNELHLLPSPLGWFNLNVSPLFDQVPYCVFMQRAAFHIARPVSGLEMNPVAVIFAKSFIHIRMIFELLQGAWCFHVLFLFLW